MYPRFRRHKSGADIDRWLLIGKGVGHGYDSSPSDESVCRYNQFRTHRGCFASKEEVTQAKRHAMKADSVKRLLATLVALLSVLYSQLAVAAFACPAMFSSSSQVAVASVGSAQMNCVRMNGLHPSACRARINLGKQAAVAVKKALGYLAGPGPAFVVPVQPAAFQVTSTSPNAPGLLRATSPPLAVRFCRFQI
ncbi:hypothetical protein [Pandoraea sp.]|uniref:hypothetical protein n=1 Tax=Pandoraea sp. TaxID=1883445 RepID=UPI00120FC117|nr:hypothetical protein [Pandoraea sp.]TAL55695.1 MAG: hypothetical protein EPN80_06390 [Pandoraea sp.]TAM14385.1 MAG: hypothetical protein EPN65_21150 [Pandoraea sp.]